MRSDCAADCSGTRIVTTASQQQQRDDDRQQHGDGREPAVARSLRQRERLQRGVRRRAAAPTAAGEAGAAARAAPARATTLRRTAGARARASRSGPPSSARGTASPSPTGRGRDRAGGRAPRRSSSVFCSSTSCGWISTLKRRDARNSCTSTLPSEISFSGRSKIGSQTTRISLSSSSTRVSARHPARLEVRRRDAVVVAAEEREEVLREVALVLLGQRAHDAEVERDVLAVVRPRRRRRRCCRDACRRGRSRRGTPA